MQAQASIVFDVNDPIVTNTFSNTVDKDPPTSRVEPLPEGMAYSPNPRITLLWSSDDAAGSGVRGVDLFVSRDGAAPQMLLSDSLLTSLAFDLEREHTYAFFTMASDNVGHTELEPAAPDVAFTYYGPPWNNPRNRFDVTGDGFVVPQDVLVIINQLNNRTVMDATGAVILPPPTSGLQRPYYDVTGDNFIAAIDALNTINFINRASGEGECRGEAPFDSICTLEISSFTLALPLDSGGPTDVAARTFSDAKPSWVSRRSQRPDALPAWDAAPCRVPSDHRRNKPRGPSQPWLESPDWEDLLELMAVDWDRPDFSCRI